MRDTIGATARRVFAEGYQETTITVMWPDSETSLTITNSDIVEDGFTIDRYCCTADTLELGSAVAAQLELILFNRDGRFDDVEFNGSSMVVTMRATRDGTTVNDIHCGYFTVVESEKRSNGTIKVTALDRMIELDVTVSSKEYNNYTEFYDAHAAVSPVAFVTYQKGTLGWLLYWVLSDTNTLDGIVPALNDWERFFPNETAGTKWTTTKITDIPNMGNVTYRALLMNLIGLAGKCAYFDGYGYLNIQWYTETSWYRSGDETYPIYKSDRFSSEINTDSRYGYYGVQFQIAYYPHQYVTDTSEYLQFTNSGIQYEGQNDSLWGSFIFNVWWQLSETGTYYPFTADILSAPYLFPLDIIHFYVDDETYYQCLVTHVTVKLNGSTYITGNEKPHGDNNGSDEYSWQSSQTGQNFAALEKRVKALEEGGGSTLIEKTIVHNGVYEASSDNADGYSKVTVNVGNNIGLPIIKTGGITSSVIGVPIAVNE